MTIKGDVVKEYLAEFPEVPSLTLARMIYAENVALFRDTEETRRVIRYYRGSSGGRDAKQAEKYGLTEWEGEYNPFDALPEGLTAFAEWEPVPIKGENILAISDVHVPYHHKESFKIALTRGRDAGIDTLLILGDFIDFYSLSFFERDPNRRDFNSELQTTLQVFDIIRQALPDVEIILLMGNHEERHNRYMRVKAPELINVKNFSFEEVFKTEKYKITVIGDKRIIKVGKYLNCIHGHEFGRSISSPVNPARGLYMKGKEIAMCAHHHQTSHHTEKSMIGEIISCWSLGCLCDLRPEYLPINKWNHGFAEITRDGTQFHLENRRIINGRIY